MNEDLISRLPVQPFVSWLGRFVYFYLQTINILLNVSFLIRKSIK
jgi:hypothetical protein